MKSLAACAAPPMAPCCSLFPSPPSPCGAFFFRQNATVNALLPAHILVLAVDDDGGVLEYAVADRLPHALQRLRVGDLDLDASAVTRRGGRHPVAEAGVVPLHVLGVLVHVH